MHGGAPAPPFADPGNPRAALGLFLANLGLFVLCISLGFLFFVAGPLAFTGFILGVSARGKVRRGETRKGRSTASAAMIAGVIGMGLSLLAIPWIVLFLDGTPNY